jgi:hypothetical protein
VLIGGTLADENPSFSNFNVFMAIEAFGPMAARQKDRMGVSGWYSGLTDDVKDLTSTVGIDLRDTWGVEFYYNAEIIPSLHLTGDLQIVQNQNEGHDLAIIPGVRLVIDF